MDKNFIGRKEEIQILQDVSKSDRAEFIAVYGRRRVGKTYLIQQFYSNKFAFNCTGIIDGTKDEEMFAFTSSLIKAGYSGRAPENWIEAFEFLGQTLDKEFHSKQIVIYIDELPCFDTPKSGFVRALGYFWNTWASTKSNVKLIVCGSATSWMLDNLINSHGGLHNRMTHSIYLRQFTLAETEEYLKSRGIMWHKRMIVETYMILGGVPYYLSLLNRKESLAQNIDRLYFEKNSELSNEFNRLYASLFKYPEFYLKIIEALSKHKYGMTRKQITEALKVTSSGSISTYLDNLISCDIIRRYVTKSEGKIKKNSAYYQLIDFFSLFHLNFSKKLTTDDYWQQHINTPVVNSWMGLAFEHICFAHINQIRRALGLERVAVEFYSWRNKNTVSKENISQVDLIIERADHLINLCEIKFSNGEYNISKNDDMKMRKRIDDFICQTKTKCGVLPTWITTYGLQHNEFSADIAYQVTMEDLFKF